MKKVRSRIAIGLVLGGVVMILIPGSSALAETDGTFKGAWTANGQIEPMEFSPGREVFLFRLSGHVNLTSDLGNDSDYWAEIVGIWDEKTGATARCSWREIHGRGTAFATLEGNLLEEDLVMVGEFVAGTGELEGLTGSFTFNWSQVIKDGKGLSLTAHSTDLIGAFHLP